MAMAAEKSVEECIAILNKRFDEIPHDPNQPARRYEYVYVSSSVGKGSGGEDAPWLKHNFLAAFHACHTDDVVTALLELGEDREFLRELDRQRQRLIDKVNFFSRRLVYRGCRRTLPPLAEAATVYFREGVFEAVKGKAARIVLAMLERRRMKLEVGEETEADASVAKATLTGVFMGAGTWGVNSYGKDFEEAMLDEVEKHYSYRAAIWVPKLAVSDYMTMAKLAIDKEREIARRYLPLSSETPVIEKVRKTLLLHHVARFSEDDRGGLMIRALIRRAYETAEDVKRIFRVGYGYELNNVVDVFRDLVVEEGLKIVGGVQKKVVIRKLIDLHERHRTMVVRDCFDNSEVFTKALSTAFESVTSKKVPSGESIAELLADFCDSALPAMIGGGGEEILDKVVLVLDCVYDKDEFVKCHREKLSRRLLFGCGAGIDLDKLLIEKLRQRFGVDYTAELDGMVRDIEISKSRDEIFANDILLVAVLTPNYWPSYKYLSDAIVIPAEMARRAEAFEEIYKIEFPERKLSFVHPLGTCTVEARFKSKTIELEVSTHQAAVLMLFNDKDGLVTYSDMKTELKMDDQELTRVLSSLSCEKHRILKKRDDRFEFNSRFDSPKAEIKMALKPATTAKDKKKLETELDKGRRYAVDAALVRVMKRKRVLKYQDIIRECFDECRSRFVADVKMIKMRIDGLTERDFMERVGYDSDIFRYVA